ncbi:MraY family glycosyltransferase [Persicobacter diffluens]|uniref:Undecaprenyl-phosphate alpha-N-acetylglucosaminyl 1-phosphate transferase n=1 Tax=Persicobacter diffluens TaxID=981 RepID=A0AAN4VYW9_9BACT|nr:undecaprenyl-phosphate alpha-N-acetylglucosaminyl 1-phosphate transferase [Persicobacter diffluens]
MDLEIYFPFELQAAVAFLAALVLAVVSIPVIIKVSLAKGLFDEPNGRSSHLRVTPTLGGVAIFISLVLPYLLFGGHFFTPMMQYIFAGIVIIFFIGIKDDILVIAPMKKLAAQILASLIVILLADIRIGSMFGIFGIASIPYAVSVVLSLFVYVVMINAINLIDGIDGLAGGMGIVLTSFLGAWFYWNGQYSLALLAIVLIAALIGFLRFNFSKGQKIFMGDTGSLLLGFILAVLNIQFIHLHEQPEALRYAFHSAPSMAVLLFSIPLFDTLRVFSVRLSQKKSPFFPDRNHIHHIFLDKGLVHWKATVLICAFNISYVLLFTYVVEALSVPMSLVFIGGLFLFYVFALKMLKMPIKGRMFVNRSEAVLDRHAQMKKRA